MTVNLSNMLPSLSIDYVPHNIVSHVQLSGNLRLIVMSRCPQVSYQPYIVCGQTGVVATLPPGASHVRRWKRWQCAALLDMSPRLEIDHMAYQRSADAVLISQYMLRHVALIVTSADCLNYALRKFRAASIFASRTAVLLIHVFVVVCASTSKQMFRIAAWWIIAAVAHVQLAGVNAIRKIVCKAVCSIGNTVNIEAPIIAAQWDRRALPQPALIGSALLNERPETGSVLLGDNGKDTILDSHAIHPPVMKQLVRATRCVDSTRVACFV